MYISPSYDSFVLHIHIYIYIVHQRPNDVLHCVCILIRIYIFIYYYYYYYYYHYNYCHYHHYIHIINIIYICICICCIMYPNQYPHVQLRSAPALSLSNVGNPMPKAYHLGMVHTSFTTLLHVLMVGSHLDPTFLLCFNHVKLLNHSNIF